MGQNEGKKGVLVHLAAAEHAEVPLAEFLHRGTRSFSRIGFGIVFPVSYDAGK
jgi:hypothetical protein